MANYNFEFDAIDPKPLLNSLDDYGFHFSVKPRTKDWRSDQTRTITLHLEEDRIPEALSWVQQFYEEDMTEEYFDTLLIRKAQ